MQVAEATAKRRRDRERGSFEKREWNRVLAIILLLQARKPKTISIDVSDRWICWKDSLSASRNKSPLAFDPRIRQTSDESKKLHGIAVIRFKIKFKHFSTSASF